MGKVGVVELENLSAPASGGSSFGSEATDVDAIVREASDLAAIGLLRCFLDPGTAAFEDENMLALARQFNGENDARRSGSDDANVGRLCVGFGQALHQIMNQGRNLP